MPNLYTLVNPHIQGEFENTLKADNSILAAKSFYKNLSEHFNNAVPMFHFTIQKGKSGKGKYYHFKTTETKNNNEVTFNVKSYKMKMENMKAFETRLNAFKNKIQLGGKKHKKTHKKKNDSDDSDSSDTDSSDSEQNIKNITTYTPIINQPIYYWWYDPHIYNLKSIFIPTFYSYITPIIEYSLILG
jgi:hypothetical protein